MTDESKVYTKVGCEFAQHGIVNYSVGEYVRGEITTNTVESSFAIFKRSLCGTFHQVSEAHLQRYATEADFKWNQRIKLCVDDAARTTALLKGISDKRLTYRQPQRDFIRLSTRST